MRDSITSLINPPITSPIIKRCLYPALLVMGGALLVACTPDDDNATSGEATSGGEMVNAATGELGGSSGGSEESMLTGGDARMIPESCMNGVQDRRESDVDCGGPDCRRCASGDACGRDLDCISRSCLDGVCDGAGAGAEAGTEAGTTSADELSCSVYCEQLINTCGTIEEMSQYDSLEECEGYCAAVGWPVGDSGELESNTLACRYTYALAAADETDNDEKLKLCETAGSSGGGVCGTWCDVLCESSEAICNTSMTRAYADVETCQTACELMPHEQTNLYGFAVPNYLYYDSVQCRIRHLRSAVGHSAPTHCPHASASSKTEACDNDSKPNCAHYCDMMSKHCGGGGRTCLSECGAAFTDEASIGEHADFSGDTLGCRINQAEWARDCDSAALVSAGECVDVD